MANLSGEINLVVLLAFKQTRSYKPTCLAIVIPDLVITGLQFTKLALDLLLGILRANTPEPGDNCRPMLKH